MSQLYTARRDALPPRSFAYVDSLGGEHLPIHDAAHVRNAAARFSQTRFESAEARKTAARRIVEAAQQHGIELSDDDAVVRAAA
ncbi:DUF6582 domain-containing protein [Ottowia sp.]|uniref:DUF6582 domain-containing protein n=1 Tax=Ottowia sp. TaxID=1898956 RepID=UPI001D6B7DBC|nr:DUF6582 domain-containing protein [Ottowia sp.]MCB2033597.1 hypothetical protein [Ottowia sp.]MCP5259641.1 hypothetical protein [Burkholderiaceae bacterium]HRW71774.1 hypothetical protein [Ottowia sp.]